MKSIHNSKTVTITRKEYNELQTLKKLFEFELLEHTLQNQASSHESRAMLEKELFILKRSMENVKCEKAFYIQHLAKAKKELEQVRNQNSVLNLKETTYLGIIDKKDNQIRGFQDFLDGSSSCFQKYQIFLNIKDKENRKNGKPRVIPIDCKRGREMKGQMQKVKLKRMMDTIAEGKLLEFDYLSDGSEEWVPEKVAPEPNRSLGAIKKTSAKVHAGGGDFTASQLPNTSTTAYAKVERKSSKASPTKFPLNPKNQTIRPKGEQTLAAVWPGKKDPSSNPPQLCQSYKLIQESLASGQSKRMGSSENINEASTSSAACSSFMPILRTQVEHVLNDILQEKTGSLPSIVRKIGNPLDSKSSTLPGKKVTFNVEEKPSARAQSSKNPNSVIYAELLWPAPGSTPNYDAPHMPPITAKNDNIPPPIPPKGLVSSPPSRPPKASHLSESYYNVQPRLSPTLRAALEQETKPNPIYENFEQTASEESQRKKPKRRNCLKWLFCCRC